jgi:quercetin dioxygenase-like cupin family protein
MSVAAGAGQAVGSFASLPAEEPFPGVRRQAFTTRQATVTRYTFAPGATFPLHSHPQEQITLIEAGSVEMTIAGEPLEIETGGWSVVEGEIEHGITAGADGATVIAIVSPPRAAVDEYEISSQGPL